MSKDLRQYARSTQLRLIVGFLALVFLVGDGLIFIFYGRAAGLTGLVCLLSTLLPVGLVLLLLGIADRVVKKQR